MMSDLIKQIEESGTPKQKEAMAKKQAAHKAARKKAKKKTTKKKVTKKRTTKKKAAKKKIAKKKSTKKIESNQIAKRQATGNRINNGGARKGSGRKKGATTKKTREIADKLADSDEITPLEYMLGVLRETPEKLKARFDAGDIDSQEYIVELQAMQKRKDNAAEKAAPYIHPRLSSIEAKVSDGTHEKWLALMENMDK